MDGAACRKARASMFSLCWKTTNRRVSADDRSDRLATAITIFDERYDDSPDSRTLYVSVATLKLILHLKGSQCSFWRVAEILVRPCWRVTTLASVFWMRSSLWTYIHTHTHTHTHTYIYIYIFIYIYIYIRRAARILEGWGPGSGSQHQNGIRGCNPWLNI